MPVNAAIQEDWDNRELVQTLSKGVKDLVAFINRVDYIVRHKIGELDEKLNTLERRIAFAESRIASTAPQPGGVQGPPNLNKSERFKDSQQRISQDVL